MMYYNVSMFALYSYLHQHVTLSTSCSLDMMSSSAALGLPIRAMETGREGQRREKGGVGGRRKGEGGGRGGEGGGEGGEGGGSNFRHIYKHCTHNTYLKGIPSLHIFYSAHKLAEPEKVE